MPRSRTGSRSTSTRTRLALVAAALVALAAGVAWNRLGAQEQRQLRWTDLTASLAGFQSPDPVFRVFHDGRTLTEFQRRTMPGARPRPVRADFRRVVLVLVSAGPRSSTGYGVRVAGVVERRRSVLVRVAEVTPGLGDPVVARVTYPFRLLAVPRTGKPTGIAWERQ